MMFARSWSIKHIKTTKKGPPVPQDLFTRDKITKPDSAHNSLSPPNKMTLREKRFLEKDRSQEGSTVKKKCTSLVSECVITVPIVHLTNLSKRDHQNKQNVKKPDCGQHSDQGRQVFLEGPLVNNSCTSIEVICRGKLPVVKLPRLEGWLDFKENRFSKSHRERYSDQVPSPTFSKARNRMALLTLPHNVLLPPKTDFTRKGDQQEGDPGNKACASLESVCLKQPVVHLTRLNIEPKNHLNRQAKDETNSEHHHDHVQPDHSAFTVQPEDQEEQSIYDSDSDQFDEQDLENLSAYELERRKNIKQNAKFLKSLKLFGVASTLNQARRPWVKRPPGEALRRSMRLQGIKPLEKHLQYLKPVAPKRML
ncbi:uncharacterized protein LOC142749880 isoform X2 [Rhinoderma darwinii]|uniref:uncharacterized protein LOC142749880 isoform X2 n=1 Tax=Rhinoderma darwinii TaxID=43563 RepID=UPI003F661EB1